MNKTGFILGLLVSIVIGAWIWSIPRGSDEEQIHAVITKTADSIRKRNLGQLMACLSSKFTSEIGDYNDTRLVLLNVFRNTDIIDLAIANPTIHIKGSSATAEAAVKVSWTSNHGAATEVSSTLHIDLEKENHKAYSVFSRKEWKIVSGEISSPIPGLE